MARTACISLIVVILALSGCATGDTGANIDASALTKKGGNGLEGAYENATGSGMADAGQDRVIGLQKQRVYDLSEPGVPVRQPAETRTYWIAPRVGGDFATHGSWITVLIHPEQFVGSPMRGMYIPPNSLTPTQRVFDSEAANSDNQDAGSTSGGSDVQGASGGDQGLSTAPAGGQQSGSGSDAGLSGYFTK